MESLPEQSNPWQVLGAIEIYDNPWIKITEFDVINPSGGKGIYGKVHFKNRAIGVVAIDEEQSIYLVGQYRFPLDRYSWELPEGGGAFEETALEAAKRELLEETGLVAHKWEELLKMDLSNSVTDEQAIVFVATGLEQHNARPEPTEQLQIIKRPLQEVFDDVMAGRITDSITVAAVLKLKAMGFY